MTEYNGTTSLQTALEKLHGRKLSFDAMAKITSKYRERLNAPTGKAIKNVSDKLKIYEWERDAIKQTSLQIDSLVNDGLPIIKPVLVELNIIQSSDITQATNESSIELNITQMVVNGDVVVNAEPIVNKSNTTTNNDSKSCDKFININYRHADNSRHTIQLEQFYIDALIAIGITNISKFVAENAGMTQVTKNVKRSIVNELVKRIK